MQDKLTEIVKAGLAFGALAIPHFSDFLAALGGEAAVMQNVAGAYGIYHMVGLAVDYFRGKAAAMAAALLLLLLPATPALAQAPEPVQPTDRGGVLVSYDLADLEPGAMDRLSGFTAEVDVVVPQQSPLSVVLHYSAADPRSFTGVGPRVHYNLGPITLFGHYLFGQLSVGDMATDHIDSKKGGGVMVPLRDGLVLRIGADHDGTVSYSTVGVGWRF